MKELSGPFYTPRDAIFFCVPHSLKPPPSCIIVVSTNNFFFAYYSTFQDRPEVFSSLPHSSKDPLLLESFRFSPRPAPYLVTFLNFVFLGIFLLTRACERCFLLVPTLIRPFSLPFFFSYKLLLFLSEPLCRYHHLRHVALAGLSIRLASNSSFAKQVLL